MMSQITVAQAESILGTLAQSLLAAVPSVASSADLHLLTESVKSAGPDYESRYNALVEHIPGVIFVAPLDGRLGDAYVSPQIETILGFTREEWLEDPIRWYQQVHPDDKDRWSIEAASLFLTGKPLSSQYRVIARDGRTVWFKCDARMVHSGDGRPSFIHGIGFDITELKETEASLNRARHELEVRVAERTQELARINAELKEEIAGHERTEVSLIAAKEAAESAARVKSEFMANMSHEIRTPMNGVLGLTSLVLNTDLSADQREYLSLAQSSAESLLSVINQVLDFSKIESGKERLQWHNFKLRASIASLINELLPLAQARHLHLTFHISPDLPESLVGDLGRLRQVLTNLIGNSIKFTQTGSVSLQVSLDRPVARHDSQSCMLRFEVGDTGIGISPEQLKSIFEPFVQADGSITREYGGTGLGLAISKELVTLMGGEMSVSSEPGLGSSFSFTASFGIAAVGSTALPEQPSQPQKTKMSLRILVAEDNLVNQKVLSRLMENEGHHITVVANGREALDRTVSTPFDIVLMDVQMPFMDGLSATQAIRLREAEQGRPRLPIVGLTAHAQAADRDRCFQAGMDGYLSKPYRPAELIALIAGLVTHPGVSECPAESRPTV